MIEIDGVTRENFDDSGLSNGYAIGTQMSDIETEILTLIKGAFAGISDVPMRELDRDRTRGKLLAKTAGIQASAISLFQDARKDLFDSLNSSLKNGFTVGKNNGALQTGRSVVKTDLTDEIRGQETVRLANGSLLKAMGLAVVGAVTAMTSSIVLMCGDALSHADMTFRQAYDRFVVPQFERYCPERRQWTGGKFR